MLDVMLGIKVKKPYAERVRKYLIKHTLIDNNYMIHSINQFIYFPVRNMNEDNIHKLKKNFGASIENRNFEVIAKDNYRELLKKALGKKYDEAPKGYECVGNIAIIKSDKNIAKSISASIMKINKNITTVIRKSSAVKGRYRKRAYEYVAGKRTYVTEYRENGAVLVFDIRDTFFSSKLSFERSRIAALSKNTENVMVMFAGVGPFAIELALKNREAKVVAIEINRKAVKYMKENIKRNKTLNVVPIQGDVNKVGMHYKRFADRIIMPLPKDSGSFLEAVVKIAKEKCIVHYYSFVAIDNGAERLEKMLKEFFNKKGFMFKKLMSRTVRPYSPETFEIVIDFEIIRK